MGFVFHAGAWARSALALNFPARRFLSSGSGSVNDYIEELIRSNDVVLFMKGTKRAPQCGFSSATVKMLEASGVSDFKDVDVMSDGRLREAIKKYSSWPTIPQVYIKGDFVGGYDILLSIYKTGKLKKLLIEHNIVSQGSSLEDQA